MRMFRTRVPARDRSRHLLIVAALALASVLGGCTDAGNVTAIDRADAPMRFTLVPRFHVFGSVSNLAPINLAHLTVLDAATRDTIAATVTITLNPSSAQWQLPVDFTLPDAATEANIIVLVELLSLTDGVATIEWSGETPPISVTPGAAPTAPAPIDLVQGPPDNLLVASIDIVPVTGSVREGESVQLHAVTVGTGTPVVFWAALDPARATVSPSGQVTALLPGAARVVASAGIRVDTITLQIRQRPSSVAVVPALLFTSLGAELSLTGRVLDPRGAEIAGEAVVFTVDNPAILDQTGPASFRARAAGVTSIFAAAASRPTVRSTVAASVFQSAASITLSSTSLTFRSLGESDNVVGAALDAGGAIIPGAVLQWRSENPAIADVTPGGLITARGAGTTGIVATLQGASARVVVSVNQTIASLSLTPASVLIEGLSGTATLAPVARDPGGALVPAPAVTWSSSAPAVASVSATGVVTANGNGAATITVSAPGAITASSEITVRQRVATIAATPATATLRSVGETVRATIEVRDPNGRVAPLTFSTYTWSTDAAAVATVDQTGLITARGNGTATITVRAASGASATVSVTVAQQVTALTVTPGASNLRNPGDFVQLTARAVDAQGNTIPAPTIAWSSSVAAVASVDATGKVTAHTSGAAVITASSGSVQGTANVTVQLQVASIQVSPASTTITTTDPTQFTAVARDASGSVVDGAAVTWSSSNATIVSIDLLLGIAYGQNNGSAVITATAENGVSGQAPVTVDIVRPVGVGVNILPTSPVSVSNCIPFGSNTGYQFTGFIYRNIPAFRMNVGDRIAFDLGSQNDVDVRRNIFFAPLNKNPGPPGGGGGDVPSQDVRALSWTKVVAESHIPAQPRGNTVVGDYELVYTASAEFDFPGGGFAIGFQGSPPATYYDGGCDQVLAGTLSIDASGLFYARFFSRPDQTLGTLDVPGGGTGQSIGGVRIYPAGSPAPRAILSPAGLRAGSAPARKPAGSSPVAGERQDPLPPPARKKAGGDN